MNSSLTCSSPNVEVGPAASTARVTASGSVTFLTVPSAATTDGIVCPASCAITRKFAGSVFGSTPPSSGEPAALSYFVSVPPAFDVMTTRSIFLLTTAEPSRLTLFTSHAWTILMSCFDFVVCPNWVISVSASRSNS